VTTSKRAKVTAPVTAKTMMDMQVCYLIYSTNILYVVIRSFPVRAYPVHVSVWL
jgi:hypothetical protein